MGVKDRDLRCVRRPDVTDGDEERDDVDACPSQDGQGCALAIRTVEARPDHGTGLSDG
jgi:hypothetical protein